MKPVDRTQRKMPFKTIYYFSNIIRLCLCAPFNDASATLHWIRSDIMRAQRNGFVDYHFVCINLHSEAIWCVACLFSHSLVTFVMPKMYSKHRRCTKCTPSYFVFILHHMALTSKRMARETEPKKKRKSLIISLEISFPQWYGDTVCTHHKWRIDRMHLILFFYFSILSFGICVCAWLDGVSLLERF